MRKVAQLNITTRGSTGRLMSDIQDAVENTEDIKCLSFYGRGKRIDDKNFIKFGSELSFIFHVLYTFVFNKQGHFAKRQTKKLIAYLEDYKPDVIHLHNIQGYYLNYPLFFDWLSHYKGQVIWTLHDCWAFTGHCCYFTKAKCDKWVTGCHHCPQKHEFPFSWFFDTSESEYTLKKQLFTSIQYMTITTPSNWVKELVEKSFLNVYPIKVINNWVDLNVFKPLMNQDTLDKFGIDSNKKIILGVANLWEERKGLNVFVNLSKVLSDEYQIVMVGLNKKQINKLPTKMVKIQRTDNQNELAELYSSAYVFLNPSIEETFSLVTLEALACNTPVIVQNTSAVHEMVSEGCGIVMSSFVTEDYVEAIHNVSRIDRDNQKIRKSVLKYNKKDKVDQYLKLYNTEIDK